MSATQMEADLAIETSLDSISSRLGRARADFDGAAGVLRELAHGRRDLLAAVAGSKLARPFAPGGGEFDPDEVYAAGLLLLAGADTERAVYAYETLASPWPSKPRPPASP